MRVLRITLILLAFSQSQAQPASGVISGVITSGSSGLPVANATVTLTNTSFLAHTDTNGFYRLSNIPSGVYELRVSAAGFMRMICYDLTVTKSVPVVVPIKLSPGSQSGDITSTMRLVQPQVTEDRMLFYQPDSTIDFKLKIVNPEAIKRGPDQFFVPDSNKKHN